MSTPKLGLLILDTHDINTLGIGDISSYPQGFSILSPSIEITPPGFNRITLPFTAKNATIYNSNTLEITCSDDECQFTPLPDGVWKIRYSISPSNEYYVEKSFLRSYQIEEKFGKAWLQATSQDEKEVLDDAWGFIQGAISSANGCNDIQAMNLYRLADKIIDNYSRLK